MSSSPKSKGDKRPNADVVPGRHPERWRKDAAGNVVCKRFCNCQGCLCFEYDHIVLFSKGGESTEGNCHIPQTRVNRYESDKRQSRHNSVEREDRCVNLCDAMLLCSTDNCCGCHPQNHLSPVEECL